MNNGELYRIKGFINNLNYAIDNNLIKATTPESKNLLKNIIIYLNNLTKDMENDNINYTVEKYRIMGILQNLNITINNNSIITTTINANGLIKNLIEYLSELKNSYDNIPKK